MKLGFVSAILPDLSLHDVLITAGELGYDCVELMCWPKGKAERRYAGVTHVDVSDFQDWRASKIRSMLEVTHVTISALSYYPNPLSPDKKESQKAVEHLRKVIEASATLGVGHVNSFIGRDWKKSVDDNWPRFLDVWGPLIEHAEKCDVYVGIENCPMLFTNDEWPGGKNLAISPAIWQRMFEDIPSKHFGLNYDPSHLVWQHIDYLEPLWQFADRLHHAHAKDVRVDRHRLNQVGILATPLEYHSPKLPGMGEVDWGKFVSVLGDVGYNGPVCVEVEDRAYEDSLESRKAALRQSCTFLRNFIPQRH